MEKNIRKCHPVTKLGFWEMLIWSPWLTLSPHVGPLALVLNTSNYIYITIEFKYISFEYMLGNFYNLH